MIYKPMDPAHVRKLLEGQDNIITPAVSSHEEFFKKLSCPRCGGEVMPFLDPSSLFKTGSVLPNYLARCKACATEFEPYTKIEVSIPKPGRVNY